MRHRGLRWLHRDGRLDDDAHHVLVMRLKAREQQARWRDPKQIWERYFRLCEQLHVGSRTYDLEFSKEAGALVRGFRKDAYRVGPGMAG